MLTKLCLVSFFTSGLVVAALESRAACGETAAKVCYGVDGGTSQGLDPVDIAYVASYLRFIGNSNKGADKFWNMEASIDCQEWTLPVPNAATVLPLAKHINQRYNSSILYTDLADTIDGGEDATDEEKAASLTGCGTHGGQLGVTADLDDPAYQTDEYEDSTARPSGILIKLVRDPNAD